MFKKRLLIIFMMMVSIILTACQGKTHIAHENTLPVIGNRQKFLSVVSPGYGFTYDMALDRQLPTDESSKPNTNYSPTNTQVLGVDEADLVKTDGKYIYSISNQALIITKAMDEATIAKVIHYKDNFHPTEIYVDENRLIVIGLEYQYLNHDNIYSLRPIFLNTFIKTVVYVYNLEDWKLSHTIKMDGHKMITRKVGDQLLLVTEKYIPYKVDTLSNDEILPHLIIDGQNHTIGYDEIYYHEDTNPSAIVTVYRLDLNDLKSLDYYSYLGSTNVVYVSEEHLYISLPIYTYLKNVFKVQTFIMRIKFNQGLTFSGEIYVEGYVNNQFMLDEYEGYLRIATINHVDQTSVNNLYIYNEDLELTGKIENIAPGETIQSTRFVGKRIYFVTFRQIDPFFVIDAEDPTNPVILGELKIPGYSTYLHPYDEHHVIGFGYMTNSLGQTTGFKMALFDVTNPQNPIEKFNFIYEGEGLAYSQVSYNHKALLFSKERNLIAFPMRYIDEVTETELVNGVIQIRSQKIYREDYFVYHLDLEHGFTLQKKISHLPEGMITRANYYYINRGLYIGEYLYTISEGKIMIHTLDTYEFVKEIDLLQVSEQIIEYNEIKYYKRNVRIKDYELYEAEVEGCLTALEFIVEDADYVYYFPCIKSWAYVLKQGNEVIPIKEALNQGKVTINDLMPYIPIYSMKKK